MHNQGYRLYTVVPRLLEVIDNLTNWYIRFNRKRLKGVAGFGLEDTKEALSTLCQVLFTLVRALAPFIPFITEHIYGLLKPYLGEALSEFKDTRSVHFLSFPTVQENLFDEEIERKVAAMQAVIQLGRTARERKNISFKTPLLSLVVVSDQQRLSDVDSLVAYVKEELNVREVILSSDEERYNIQLEARVDWPTLGKKLKRDAQVVRKALPTLPQEQLRSYLRDGKLNINGIELEGEDLTIVRVVGKEILEPADKDGPQYEPAFSKDFIILLDAASHPELLDDGLARDVINRVQKMRKKAGLVPTDDVLMQYGIVSNPDEVDIETVVSSRRALFEAALRGTLERDEKGEGKVSLLEEEHTIGTLTLMLKLVRL